MYNKPPTERPREVLTVRISTYQGVISECYLAPVCGFAPDGPCVVRGYRAILVGDQNTKNSWNLMLSTCAIDDDDSLEVVERRLA